MKDKLGEYKIELEEVQENFRVAEAENEKLQVTNDIQNLWKIWIEEHHKKHQESNEKSPEKKTNKGDCKNNEKKENSKNVHEEEEEDEEDVYEEIKAYLLIRKQGFTRDVPASSSEPRTKTKPVPTPKQTYKTTNNPQPGPRTESRSRYCFFWNNIGKCTFQNYKFSHEQVPVCKFDGNCIRTKCMFQHFKQNVAVLADGPTQYRSPPAHYLL